MAGCYDIEVDQGATFAFLMVYKDDAGNRINIEDYDPKMDIRVGYKGSELALSLTEGNGIDFAGADQGVIEVTITADQTADLVLPLYRYDLELTHKTIAGQVIRLIEGQIETTLEVTD